MLVVHLRPFSDFVLFVPRVGIRVGGDCSNPIAMASRSDVAFGGSHFGGLSGVGGKPLGLRFQQLS